MCVCVLLRTATGGEQLSELVLGIQLGNLVVVLGRRLAGGLRSSPKIGGTYFGLLSKCVSV